MPQAPLTPELIKIPEKINNDLGLKAQLVTTADGQWAVQVIVPSDSAVPIQEIEEAVGPHRIEYRESESQVIARPAYPHLGE